MPRRSDFDISSLAPMAHAEDLQELYATSPSLFTLSDSVEAYVRDQARRTPNEAALQALISRSPAVPRPPPNTPLTAAASRGHSKRTSAPMTSPPSPPSPQQMRVHTFSTQQTRSIPLARLMQRRLSAVPEEDALSQLDEGLPMPTPDVYPRSRSHSLNPGPPDVQTSQLNYLLSPAFSGQHTRVSDPRRGALLPGTSSSNDSALLNIGTGQVAVQVKLPGAHTRGYAGNTRTDNRNHQAPERREFGREESVRNSESARGGSQRRGGGRGRGKGGRNGANRVINGPERVDGGLMVKS
ncbi:uncharacterized protein B0H18DRAFT_410002 [Fomitopsis serialis]|uniref:uncharacterized protein n=1 Tax=Fomitopsis serialis TaxID=139415 RepID=UPI00200891C4|nr:uncharacterized protein B0H18DRAFT_410002 [Neoantrodia serialis]KAH9935312.1 hypothetical protein B0H18DRAFT_410002 [Neoantrodia serialis]